MDIKKIVQEAYDAVIKQGGPSMGGFNLGLEV